jgi:hypothetical protein
MGNSPCESLVKFNISELPKKASSVTLRLWCTDILAEERPIKVDQITGDWNKDTKWAQNPPSIFVSTTKALSKSAWVEIDVTDLYNKWQSGAAPNYGIRLRDGGDTVQLANFANGDVNVRPILVVKYRG